MLRHLHISRDALVFSGTLLTHILDVGEKVRTHFWTWRSRCSSITERAHHRYQSPHLTRTGLTPLCEMVFESGGPLRREAS